MTTSTPDVFGDRATALRMFASSLGMSPEDVRLAMEAGDGPGPLLREVWPDCLGGADDPTQVYEQGLERLLEGTADLPAVGWRDVPAMAPEARPYFPGVRGLGDRPVRAITEEELQALVHGIRAYSAETTMRGIRMDHGHIMRKGPQRTGANPDEFGVGAAEKVVQTIHIVFKTLTKKRIILVDPSQDVRAPSRHAPGERAYTDAEVQALHFAAQLTSARTDGDLVRWLLITAEATGAREEGLDVLSLSDIDPANQRIHLHEKLGKDRWVPCPEPLCLALIEFLRSRGGLALTDRVFTRLERFTDPDTNKRAVRAVPVNLENNSCKIWKRLHEAVPSTSGRHLAWHGYRHRLADKIRLACHETGVSSSLETELIVAEWLGHGTARTDIIGTVTARYGSHRVTREVMDRVAAALFPDWRQVAA